MKNPCKSARFYSDTHDPDVNSSSPPLKIRGGRVGF